MRASAVTPNPLWTLLKCGQAPSNPEIAPRLLNCEIPGLTALRLSKRESGPALTACSCRLPKTEEAGFAARDLVAHLDSCPRRISMHAISCVHAEHQRDALKGLGIRLPITNCSWRTF